jgi:hypothetical protein
MLRAACVVAGLLSLVLLPAAQTSGSDPVAARVPPLIQFSNVATDDGGNPLSGVVSITFSLYAAAQSGEPLWRETQNNVQLDPSGHYSAQLGITKPSGVPTTLFTSGEARWLGVRIAEQAEQPRVLLVSVPYALKAGDAATIGGLPPSAFVLAAAPSSTDATSATSLASSTTNSTALNLAGSGTVDFVPLWTPDGNTLGNSAMFQSGTSPTAKIGINTTTPASALDINGSATIRGPLSLLGTLSLPAAGAATAATGRNSQPLDLTASAFNSGTSTAVNQTFQWQAEPAANNTSASSGTLNLLFGSGTSKPSETGFNIASNGQITFATGQTFPDTGTITGVTTASGSGLMGGGTSGALNLALTNTCAARQVLQWSGTAWACTAISSGGGTITGVTAGTDLTGGGTSGSVKLNVDTSKIPQLGAANSFTQTQAISASSTTQVLRVTQSGTGTSGDAIHGVTSSSGGSGVFGEGAIGIQGLANPSTGLAGLFRGTVKTTGNRNNILAGDPGCGSGYAGVGFTTGSLSCTNYALLGGSKGETFINSSGTAKIHFRSNNNELVTIDNNGNLKVIGQNGGGNLTVAGALTVNGQQTFKNTLIVSGTNSSGMVQATNILLAGEGPAIVGTTFSSQANAIKGIVNNTAGKTAGVLGLTQSTANGYGVEGQLGSLSSVGQGFAGSIGGAGVWGDAGLGTSGNAAVQGSADDGGAGLFLNNSNTLPALVVGNNGSGGGCTGCSSVAASTALVLVTEGGVDGSGKCSIDVTGNMGCTGRVGADAPVDGGMRRVALYATQATENWFEDAGSGQLHQGSARIALDPTFAQTANTGVDYHVFLTPNGDCKGLYVSRKSPTSFEVHELGGGTSSVAFDYRIMAKRRGFENVRLADLTERYQKIEAARQRMRPVRDGQGSQSPLEAPKATDVRMTTPPPLTTEPADRGRNKADHQSF